MTIPSDRPAVIDLDSPTPAILRRNVAARIEQKLAQLEADRVALTDLLPKTSSGADFTVVDLFRITELLGCSMADAALSPG